MPERMLRLTSSESETPLSLRGVALAGTLASITAAFLVCRVPHASPRSLPALTLLFLSLKYVVMTLAWGVAATWIYFRRSTTQPVRVFATLARSLYFLWLLFPPLVLFLFEESPGLLLIAPAAAAALALCLQKFLSTETQPSLQTSREAPENALFAELPPPPAGRRAALLSSLCIYAAIIAAVNGAIVKASIFLAACAFLLMSRWTATAIEAAGETKKTPPSAARMIAAAITAILVTWVALFPWLRSLHVTVGVQAAHSSTKSAPPMSQNAVGAAADAWHAILLWPFPPRKEKMLPPLPHRVAASAGPVPLVIPFDGEYRYYETPGLWIPSQAHLAKGSPLDVNIHSADWAPLVMEAHQQLAAPLDLACCREIQVSLRNADNRPGRILLGLVLTDTARPGKPSLILEPQPVLSSEATRFTHKAAAEEEILSFVIPSQPKIGAFDEITILFFPDPERAALGSKISIDSFVLLPR